MSSVNNRGFTLVELMIVVAIVGILASIAIPNYRNYVAQAQVSEGFIVTAGLRSEIAIWAWENKAFPDSTAVTNTGSIGQSASSLEGKYIKKNGISVAANTGIITVEFDKGSIIGKNLVMEPTINTSNGRQIIRWTCSGTVGVQLLPRACL